jgi:hypothetical protein
VEWGSIGVRQDVAGKGIVSAPAEGVSDGSGLLTSHQDAHYPKRQD